MSDPADAATGPTVTTAVVLAAGASRRMGRSKPLLRWGDGTLLSHTVQTCRAAGASDVVVVVRPGEETSFAAASDARIVVNDDAHAGPGSSIRCGVAAAAVGANVLVTLCDTPLVTSSDLRRLIAAPPSAAAFDGTIGPPACWPAESRDDLLATPNGRGGKRLLLAFGDRLTRVPIAGAARDLDTPERYRDAYREMHGDDPPG